MTVVALIDGYVCGQGLTQNAGGQIVYSLNVVAAGPSGMIGCGAPRRTVTFRVNNQPMSPHATWNNDVVWNFSLGHAYPVYLSLIKKG